jgi:branched-chain amino acid transport system substrate-binding protein
MIRIRSIIGLTLSALVWAVPASAQTQIKIGVLTDMSGPYSDSTGNGSVVAARLAVEDFEPQEHGMTVEVISADHQNKPDIGAQKFRQWADRDGLTMVMLGANTGVSLAMASIAKEKKIPFFAIGATGASLTGKDCTPYTVHYVHDTTALGNGTATAILDEGGKTWFFLTSDYAFGTQLQEAAAQVVTANGGKVLGAVRVPIAAPDFASYLLQAQSSGAQVLALANAGSDFTNSLKAAEEFGLFKTMRPAALLAFISDIHALGLETAQGLYLTAAWYWDLNDKTRAFAKRFFDKMGAEPTMTQAGYYSATLTYLNAVSAVGSSDADKVMDELHKTKIDDMFTDNGVIRADGLMQHDMYVMQVKKPSESKYAWDYYRVVKKIPGEQAFGKLADSTCPLVKK